MAQSRLEKIGTIFTRIQGLLRGGAMKIVDKPIWYDVYAAFPPKLEPQFDRPAAQIPIRSIFYVEDVVRAKLHKQRTLNETISLFDHKRNTQSQQFIQIYANLKAQGALDELKIYEAAVDVLAEQRQQSRTDVNEITLTATESELKHAGKRTLTGDFQETIEQQQTMSSISKTKKENNVGINIDSLFKD